MQLTENAVMALTAGAMCMNRDITAIDANGKEFYAPQICCEDDRRIRRLMQLEECNPVLEVVSAVWHGFSVPSRMRVAGVGHVIRPHL